VTLDQLVEITRLKQVERAGWLRVGVAAPESVAAHSWGVSFLVLTYLPKELDLALALAFATVHDLAEARTGDLTPADRVAPDEKYRRERVAMSALAPQLLPLWERYESQRDAEARFVRECDRLDMAVQALAYHRAGHRELRQFVASAAQVVSHPALRPILDAIDAELAAFRS
jgi:putative hydrolase of HD superfamily